MEKFFTPGGKPANGFGDVLVDARRKQGPWKAITKAPTGISRRSGLKVAFASLSSTTPRFLFKLMD